MARRAARPTKEVRKVVVVEWTGMVMSGELSEIGFGKGEICRAS